MTDRPTAHLHDAKLDALEELIEELCGQPLLVAYEFNHDLERIKARVGKNTPCIGAGVTQAEVKTIVERWNAGEIPVLLAHPASAGHGLNLQGSGAGHICWFGPTWDLELYEQFIQRIHRQGTTAGRVVNHILVAKGTIDELVIGALKDKSTTQERLLAKLNAELSAPTKENDMSFTKLSRQSEPAQAVQAAQAAAEPRQRIIPKGWGSLATAAPAAEPAQMEKITAVLTAVPEPAAEEPLSPAQQKARMAFSPEVRAKLAEARTQHTPVEALPANPPSPPIEPRPTPTIQEVYAQNPLPPATPAEGVTTEQRVVTPQDPPRRRRRTQAEIAADAARAVANGGGSELRLRALELAVEAHAKIEIGTGLLDTAAEFLAFLEGRDDVAQP